MRFIGVLVLILSIGMFILSARAVFIAFIKKKDERSKWIVNKSMAESFIILMVLQTLLMLIKWINYDFYQVWWPSLKEGIYIEPVLLGFIILGFMLLLNAKKHGGS